MKLIMIALLALTTACTSTPQTEVPPTTTVPVEEPGEKPVKLTEDGLKVGQIVEVGNKLTWKLDSWHGARPACKETDVEGGVCDMSVQGCQLPNGKKLICEQKKTWKIYGWVYHKEGPTFKPLKDAEISRFWFAGCMVGFCDVHVLGKTNEFGYYEVLTSNLMDTIRASKDGMYGACDKDKKPWIYSGQVINKPMPVLMEPMILRTITPEACK